MLKFFNKSVCVGQIDAGNIITYNYVYRGEYERISTNIYTDKDISLLIYNGIHDIRNTDKFFISGFLKGDVLDLYAYRENDKELRYISASNIDIKRFNDFFEEQKLKAS